MFAGTWRTEPPADRQPKENRSDQCLTFNDPLWPIQWELVSVTANVCVFYGSASSPLLRATKVPMVKDAPLTGISQAHFRVWLVRDGRWREVGWLQRARERGGGGGERDWPCWTETNVRDWWCSEQHTDWCVSWAVRQAHSSLSFLFVQCMFAKGNSTTKSYFNVSLTFLRVFSFRWDGF